MDHHYLPESLTSGFNVGRGEGTHLRSLQTTHQVQGRLQVKESSGKSACSSKKLMKKSKYGKNSSIRRTEQSSKVARQAKQICRTNLGCKVKLENQKREDSRCEPHKKSNFSYFFATFSYKMQPTCDFRPYPRFSNLVPHDQIPKTILNSIFLL